jgi:alpha-glucosidase (family GH31 glycosyl hydrolase)
MPVFVKAGGIVPTRTDNVNNDVQNPLSKVTLTVSTGANGRYSLYEDDGRSSGPKSATTKVRYTENDHTLRIAPAKGIQRPGHRPRVDRGLHERDRTDERTHRRRRSPVGKLEVRREPPSADRAIPTRSVRIATTISYS